VKKIASFRKATPAEPRPAPERVPPANEHALRKLVGEEVHASRKRRAGETARVVVYLPPEHEQELRLAAVRERRSLSDAVSEAVREWLAHRPRGTP